MKAREIKPCIGCGKGVMHGNCLIFYELTIGHRIIDVGAVQRRHGLEMFLGQAAPLAEVLGTDEDIAVSIHEDETVCLCLNCAVTKSITELWERLAERNENEVPR